MMKPDRRGRGHGRHVHRALHAAGRRDKPCAVGPGPAPDGKYWINMTQPAAGICSLKHIQLMLYYPGLV